MKVAVVGLGVEGKKAINSLLAYDCKIYASDLNKKIDLEPKIEDRIDIDLGFHDSDKIFSADAIVLSPSLWNTELGSQVKKSKKLLSQVIDAHLSIFTIGVTGTNGKTTTSFMIKEILENAGLKVLIGGNAGGGFEGYTELILEADSNSYDIMIVEVCDMTLDFCDHCFEFDMAVVTNLGRDHLDYHGSLEQYRDSVGKFLKGKNAILNKNDINLQELSEFTESYTFYEECDYNSLLFGEFNKLNAGAAEAVSKSLQIDDEDIKSALENFSPVEGRIKFYNINGSNVVVGKTDNADAISPVLKEMDFSIIFIGTPRSNEPWRLEILDEVFMSKPDLLVLFPGLDHNFSQVLEKIKCSDFQGKVEILDNIDHIMATILEHAKPGVNIFLGGNGQKIILEIQKKLEKLLDVDI
jgi:UDP-N-acetylmuramoylalanine--D-glutamate ligase